MGIKKEVILNKVEVMMKKCYLALLFIAGLQLSSSSLKASDDDIGNLGTAENLGTTRVQNSIISSISDYGKEKLKVYCQLIHRCVKH